jgi:hypothetical protein
MCQLSEMNKRIIKTIMILFTIGLIVKVSYELKWLDVATGIAKLETDKQKRIQRISLKSLSFIGFAGDEDAFIQRMSHMGWSYVKNYGRGMIFEKEGYEILITRRVYFKRYEFFEVTTREIFDVI